MSRIIMLRIGEEYFSPSQTGEILEALRASGFAIEILIRHEKFYCRPYDPTGRYRHHLIWKNMQRCGSDLFSAICFMLSQREFGGGAFAKQVVMIDSEDIEGKE